MKRKNAADCLIVFFMAVSFWLSMRFITLFWLRTILLCSSIIVALIFFVSFLKRNTSVRKMAESYVIPKQSITELLLLGDENAEVASWNLYARNGLVIGRDVGENHVDIDLKDSAYASMIEVEHALLNYSGGYWYVEDMGSKNGISLQKAVDGRRYKLAADKPCRLEKNDILFIAMAKLLIR